MPWSRPGLPDVGSSGSPRPSWPPRTLRPLAEVSASSARASVAEGQGVRGPDGPWKTGSSWRPAVRQARMPRRPNSRRGADQARRSFRSVSPHGHGRLWPTQAVRGENARGRISGLRQWRHPEAASRRHDPRTSWPGSLCAPGVLLHPDRAYRNGSFDFRPRQSKREAVRVKAPQKERAAHDGAALTWSLRGSIRTPRKLPRWCRPGIPDYRFRRRSHGPCPQRKRVEQRQRNIPLALRRSSATPSTARPVPSSSPCRVPQPLSESAASISKIVGFIAQPRHKCCLAQGYKSLSPKERATPKRRSNSVRPSGSIRTRS